MKHTESARNRVQSDAALVLGGSTERLTNRGIQPPPFFDLEVVTAFCNIAMVRRSRGGVEKGEKISLIYAI